MKFTKLAVLVALFGLAAAGKSKQKKQEIDTLYDMTKTNIVNYTKLNFNAQVTSKRDSGTGIVHYYKMDDGKSETEIKEPLIKFAQDNMGIFRVGAIDCGAWEQICKKEGVKEFPTIKTYPPFPVPIQDHDLSKKFEEKDLKKKVARFISDKSLEINQMNHKTFVEEDVQTPKVILFTKAAKGTPFVYKALSQHFEKTLQFGLVRASEEALAKQYKVKSWPSLYVVKAEGKPLKYDGAEFSYNGIFEFINVHSQIFIDPNSVESQQTVKKSSASKPWLVVPVAQLTKDSGNDICLQKDGSLCIVLITKNASSVDKAHLSSLHSISQGFASKIGRGIQFIVSYLVAEDEPEFAKVFGLENHDEPRIVILNPGKRKRFLIHEGDISESHIEKTLDKILGGDARFKNIKGNKLPALVSDWPTEEKK